MISFDKYDVDEALSHIIENDVILESIKQHVPENIEVSLYICIFYSFYVIFQEVLFKMPITQEFGITLNFILVM